MKFLIAGLGNIGAEYSFTRHNIGFEVLDLLAKEAGVTFSTEKYASYAEIKIKGRSLHLIKPSTYMNLSGRAVNYWKNKLNIDQQNILVITDDIALPFGKIRLKPKGSDGGHNGLKSITECLLNGDYPRLRFGVGSNFAKGRQADYVLSRWNAEEEKELPFLIDKAAEATKSFATIGLEMTMNKFN